ncbi:hypothetical protein [Sphingobacterium faecium]|nr:hypothetical protein [Sphingobacterium faecium]
MASYNNAQRNGNIIAESNAQTGIVDWNVRISNYKKEKALLS